MRDDLALRIEREARAEGEPMPEYEGQWVGRLRRIGAAKLRHWGLPCLVESAELLISELVTNALRYGTGSEVAFRFLLAMDVLVIEVGDGSPGRPRVNEADPDKESGRGMLIVASVAATWGVSTDGTTTWCTLTIPTTTRRSR
ncbi:ATP-binding protein [Streptomyces sp. NPDC004647]|uniref:ATP-binding protein n=1 Tax=Streptomyces sp. NPDC004647 TaxID=3154671 RepID=UPI0033ADD3B9